MDIKTLSITMRIELIQAKRRLLEAENDDQDIEQDDIAQYEDELNAELDREAARELNQ
tara:strand:- start:451 stop:624 length:174 start_codon:yes stop_codon:yes gene_type:complete